MCVMYMEEEHARSALCQHCERFNVRKVWSRLALFSRDVEGDFEMDISLSLALSTASEDPILDIEVHSANYLDQKEACLSTL